MLTSINNGAVAVEDHSALVQGRDSVQQVEGPEVPLTLKLRLFTERKKL